MEQKKSNHKGPSPKDGMKNRLPISEMKQPIEEYCASQQEIYLATKNDSPFPDLEVAEYRYAKGKHLIILTPASIFLNQLEEGSQVTGFIFDKQGKGLKMTKRLYGKFICRALANDDDFLNDLALTDELVKRMQNHGAKFFFLAPEECTVFFGGGEIFSMDQDMNPNFAKVAPNGKPRFEHTHHVLMEYEGKEVIFNTICRENGEYFTLTKADSNKVAYLKNDGVCKFYDGRDRHFSSKMTILPEEKVSEIYKELQECNHSFFKTPDNLLALSFRYEG